MKILRIIVIAVLFAGLAGPRLGFCIEGDEFDQSEDDAGGAIPNDTLGTFDAQMQSMAAGANPMANDLDQAVMTGNNSDESGSSNSEQANTAGLDFISPQKDSDKQYVLAPLDKIKIKIFPEDQYIRGGEMQISEDGNIILAIVGKISVAGKTVVQAQKEIAKILDADYLVNPDVVVEVLQFKEQSVIILGQVKRPGTYSFPPGTSRLTLLQAISLAGGFSDVANIKKIKLVRKANGENKVIRANAEAIISGDDEDIEIESEDVIHVSESLF